MMNNIQSIFNPCDDSLGERVRAYYSVCQAYALSQASLKQTRQQGEIDYIGEKKEVEDAFQIISQSLEQAARTISQADLQQAKAQGLLDDQQILEIVQVQRSQQMTSRRDDAQQDSSQTSLKQ